MSGENMKLLIFSVAVLVVGLLLLYITFKASPIEESRKQNKTTGISFDIKDSHNKNYGRVKIRYQSVIFESNGNKEELSKPLADLIIKMFNKRRFTEIYECGRTSDV